MFPNCLEAFQESFGSCYLKGSILFRLWQMFCSVHLRCRAPVPLHHLCPSVHGRRCCRCLDECGIGPADRCVFPLNLANAVKAVSLRYTYAGIAGQCPDPVGFRPAQIDTLKEQLDVAVAAVEGLEGTLAATRSAASAQETELHNQIKDLQVRSTRCTGCADRAR